MKKELNAVGLPIGGPSLLMAFVLLCVTTFAVISYMAAFRDYKLSEKTAQSVTQYYQADAIAVNILAELSHSMDDGQINMREDWKPYDVKVSYEKQDTMVKYQVPIKSEMILEIQVRFLNHTGEYDIVSWKQVNTHTMDDSPVFLDLPAF